jgi:hypothetical protein
VAKSRITVSLARRKHILDGDATGGGHGPGRSKSGKSEFPSSLTDDEIIAGIEVIANDATRYTGGVIPLKGPRRIIEGMIKAVRTRVIVDPPKNAVVTAYPLGVPRNP